MGIEQAYLSSQHYEWATQKAGLYDFWRRLRRQRRSPVKYDDVAVRVGARRRQPPRLEYVPIDQIVGSVGRSKDFTREFLPRPCVNPDRWKRVDAAVNGHVNLPPVELYRIGDVYFVNDGHHRISVARTNGYQGIEANVTPVESPVPLAPEDFWSERWLEKTAPHGQEEPMSYWLDLELVKLHHAERLKEAEMDRLARLVSAGQPGLLERLRQNLGERLIRLGERLKTPYQSPSDAIPLGEM